ncbi:MAG: pyridoxal phosphate-dependent aminotransferase [Clostridia bacterium]|nr:pyridoxal phosphate-dependent aminotransferase [Clostridia bacterium]
MKYDFDKIYNRRNTNSLKYDFAGERGRPDGLIPLWVADMDFRVPDEVVSVLKKKAEHGIFGYSEPKEDYFGALENWFSSRHGWNVDGRRFVQTCGVVFSIGALIRALTHIGDAVIICQPVYYPFSQIVTDNGRRLIVSELKNENGYYTVDYTDFERKICQNDVKLFILCNPHNPVGRVWTREELIRMGEICIRHGVFVISDEIHSDFVYEGNRHIPYPTLGERFEESCAVCTAPTKTFNLAGLHIANTYIYSDSLRRKFTKELDAQGYSQSNVMGLIACQAAYTYGAEWLDELKRYLAENLSFVRAYLREHIPQIKLIEPQGTYLIWLDCRALNLTDRQLKQLIQDEAKLWTDDGYIFGAGGSGFERINIACPRSTLKQALENLKQAVENIQ